MWVWFAESEFAASSPPIPSPPPYFTTQWVKLLCQHIAPGKLASLLSARPRPPQASVPMSRVTESRVLHPLNANRHQPLWFPKCYRWQGSLLLIHNSLIGYYSTHICGCIWLVSTVPILLASTCIWITASPYQLHSFDQFVISISPLCLNNLRFDWIIQFLNPLWWQICLIINHLKGTEVNKKIRKLAYNDLGNPGSKVAL